jgi:hypothetical protein
MITYHFIILVKNICVNIRMLQIEHIYRFLFDKVFYDFWFSHLPGGVPQHGNVQWMDFPVYEKLDIQDTNGLIFCYDQEPIIEEYISPYIKLLQEKNLETPTDQILITSEKSKIADSLTKRQLYYFFHGFASLDWFRGYLALNYTKNPIKNYKYDYQSFNRIVTGDRAYRKTFVDQLRENDLLKNGAVSYGVTDDPVAEQRLVIDYEQLPGSASADIPDVDAFWHIVTETVFYYDKLHLTEKIFKPIVSKQPFMLLAAPGNLEYLRSYGFKTFEGIIDESYDTIEDNDARIDAVVKQIKWYCSLSDADKFEIQRLIAPIVEYNFHHFYGKFKEIITDELLDNTKKLFKDIDYDDSGVDYAAVRKLLTS